jgi:hypothetical protein
MTRVGLCCTAAQTVASLPHGHQSRHIRHWGCGCSQPNACHRNIRETAWNTTELYQLYNVRLPPFSIFGLIDKHRHYFRANQGADGAFQKFERGEISLFPFYEAFSRELSSPSGKIWYKEYCKRRGLRKQNLEDVELVNFEYDLAPGCPPLPNVVKVDGREVVAWAMQSILHD